MNKLKSARTLTFFVNTVIILIITVISIVSFSGEKFISTIGDEYSAIYNGDRSKNNVALMFNVYENTQNVNKILDILNENDSKATFFVGGCWADDNTETLKRIVAEGHEIANHGYFHKDHKKLDLNGNLQEIQLTEKMVYALCGEKTTLFAPPSGAYNSTTLKAAASLNYKVIMWSKDTIDWRDKDGNLIIKRATNGLSGGDLVLMHPKDVTVGVLDEILKFIAENGLKATTVSQTI